jgi:hypothetical protein
VGNDCRPLERDLLTIEGEGGVSLEEREEATQLIPRLRRRVWTDGSPAQSLGTRSGNIWLPLRKPLSGGHEHLAKLHLNSIHHGTVGAEPIIFGDHPLHPGTATLEDALVGHLDPALDLSGMRGPHGLGAGDGLGAPVAQTGRVLISEVADRLIGDADRVEVAEVATNGVGMGRE